MKPTLRVSAFVLGLLISFSAIAQSIVVTGKVTSSDGTSLPGVNILIKGTATGSVTDIDGNYRLEANRGDVLVFTFIGMQSREVTVGNQSVINLGMRPDFTQLQEVVITGYGEQSLESFTGSVGVLDAPSLEQIQAPSFQQALQGRIAGVQMTSTDGQPGANAQIRIRGIGSITASSEPLYVIDGIPVQSGSISQTDFSNGGRSSNVMAGINPNDIESVTVLKDAAATAIYGSRGANGVIVITTKSGRSGEATIDFKTQFGWSSAASKNLHDGLNATEYTQLYLEGWMNRGETLAQAQARFEGHYPQFADSDPSNDPDTDWIDALTRVGNNQQYDLSASGGTEDFSYFASGSYFNQEGYLIGTDFERFTSRLNLGADLTDKLKLTNNITASHFIQNGATDGTRWANPLYNGYLLAPTIPILDDQGRYYGDHASFFMGGNNPVGKLSGDDERWLKQSRVIDNFSLSYEIIPELVFKTSWSVDFINVREFIFRNGRYGDGRNVGGIGQEANTNDINWIGSQTLTYGTTLSESHNLNFLVGYEAQKSNRDAMEMSAETYPNPRLRTLASAANPTFASSTRTKFSFVSLLSRINYDYNSKYFVSVSVRRDGSSRFGQNNRYGNFWSVGASWRPVEEAFLQNVDWLTNAKLRFSYGITGNAAIGNFPSVGLYGFGRDYDGVAGSAPSQIGNPNLTWEKQATTDLGLDVGIIDRFDLSVTYFNRLNSDLILNRPVSWTTGFRTNTQNVADMKNTGLEIVANAEIIRTSDFNWSISANVTTLTNEITSLEEAILNDPFRREEGRDFYEYYMWHWAGVDPSNGDPLWFKDETMAETTSDLSEAERFYTGKSATPSNYGGVATFLSYMGLSLDVQFTWEMDKYLYDATAWVIHGDGRFTPRSTTRYAFENRWTTPGQESEFPIHFWGNTTSSNQRNQTRYLLDGSYIRLRNVTLAYNIPSSVTETLNLRSLRVYVRGLNMWTWTRDEGLYVDPEQNINGITNSLQPNQKTLSFGIDIGI